MDLERAKSEFTKYTQNYDLTNFSLKKKIDHSFRVMYLSEEIAKNIGLNEERAKLAALIGLLHDIGRFDQMAQHGTFRDTQSFDHGDHGANLLKKDDFIRNFIETDKYDEIIIKAIKNHNKLEIEQGLNEDELLFAKLVRDADKIDIIYQATYLSWEQYTQNIESAKLTESAMVPFIEKRLIKKYIDLNEAGKIKYPLTVLSFVFDINFPITYKILKERDYLTQVIDRFNYKDAGTKAIMEKVRKIVLEQIEKW